MKFHDKDEPSLINIKAEKITCFDYDSPADAEGKFVRITLTDNGAGFDNQYSDLIFQVFQRLPGKQKNEGTGIGLAIVKKIVDKHDGIIKAFAKPNEGAVFTLVLPIQQNISDADFETRKYITGRSIFNHST
jgi:signal transduction histidine kinase